jgi:hypothetical protein
MRIALLAVVAACSKAASPAPTFQDLHVTYQVALTDPLVEYKARDATPGTLEVAYHAANHGAQLCAGSMPVSEKSYFEGGIIMQVHVDNCPASLDGADVHISFKPLQIAHPTLEVWSHASDIAKAAQPPG